MYFLICSRAGDGRTGSWLMQVSALWPLEAAYGLANCLKRVSSFRCGAQRAPQVQCGVGEGGMGGGSRSGRLLGTLATATTGGGPGPEFEIPSGWGGFWDWAGPRGVSSRTGIQLVGGAQGPGCQRWAHLMTVDCQQSNIWQGCPFATSDGLMGACGQPCWLSTNGQ